MPSIIHVDKDGMVLLDDFKQWVDVTKVEFYKITVNKDKTLTLKFYDKKRKVLKPHMQADDSEVEGLVE